MAFSLLAARPAEYCTVGISAVDNKVGLLFLPKTYLHKLENNL